MTMVPAPKLSKPLHFFYGGCGGGASDVMTRFADGAGAGAGYGGGNLNTGNSSANNIIFNNHPRDPNTFSASNGSNLNNINHNKVDNNPDVNCGLGSDLGISTQSSYHNIVLMAEEEPSRTSNSTSVNDDGGGDQQPAAAAAVAAPASSNASMKTREDTSSPPPPPSDHHHHHHRIHDSSSSWLQLGLGGTHSKMNPPSSLLFEQKQHQHQHRAQVESTAQMGGGLMLELNLGGGSGGGGGEMVQQTTSFVSPEFVGRVPHRPLDFTNTSLFGGGGGGGGGGSASGGSTFLSPHHPLIPHQLIPSFVQAHPHPQQFLLGEHHHHHQQQQIIGWGLVNHTTLLSSSAAAAAAGCSSSLSPSSSSSLPSVVPGQSGSGSFLTRPFTPAGSSVDAVDSEFRLIHPPPRRPHSGIWFTLQASFQQSKEPFLPQVSKSFLRIKDGRMTVRLVMKYLANKLGLDSESEVEIRCRGQELVPFLTLQHVRDNIWSQREAAVTLLRDTSTSDHVMVLNYGRSSTLSPSTYLPSST